MSFIQQTYRCKDCKHEFAVALGTFGFGMPKTCPGCLQPANFELAHNGWKFEPPPNAIRTGDKGLVTKKIVKRIAFDVDGTLIKKTENGDVPRYEIIAMLQTFVDLGHTVFVWSGGGVEYAENWCRKLNLFPQVRVLEKRGNAYDIDIAFDDNETSLATVDIIV